MLVYTLVKFRSLASLSLSHGFFFFSYRPFYVSRFPGRSVYLKTNITGIMSHPGFLSLSLSVHPFLFTFMYFCLQFILITSCLSLAFSLSFSVCPPFSVYFYIFFVRTSLGFV
jgi:hypothetical protein